MGISCTCLVVGELPSPSAIRQSLVGLRGCRRTCWPCAKCLLRCPLSFPLSPRGHQQMTSTRLLTHCQYQIHASSLPLDRFWLNLLPIADIICKSSLSPFFAAADVMAAIWPIPFSHCPQGALLLSLQKGKKSRPHPTAACYHFLQDT